MTLREQGIEAIREFHKKDKCSDLMGCRIVSVEDDKVICEMPISENVMGGYGHVMGGAIFTLCTFAMGVATNIDGVASTAVECNIRYYSMTKGTKLIAVCRPDKDGKKLGHFTVEVSDDLGKDIAGFTGIVFHLS